MKRISCNECCLPCQREGDSQRRWRDSASLLREGDRLRWKDALEPAKCCQKSCLTAHSAERANPSVACWRQLPLTREPNNPQSPAVTAPLKGSLLLIRKSERFETVKTVPYEITNSLRNSSPLFTLNSQMRLRRIERSFCIEHYNKKCTDNRPCEQHR